MQKSKWLPIVTAFFLCFAACSMLNEALAAYVVRCRYFNCKACTVVFQSAEEARANGYRACKVCGG